MTVTVRQDRTLIRTSGGSLRYALVHFTAPASQKGRARPPVNVAFVIDRSGSMGGGKLELAKAAVRQAIPLLRASDRFSVVFFDSDVTVAVPGAPATAEAKRSALRAIAAVQTGSSTALFDGWLAGSEQVALGQREDAISRVVLLTDGQANVGLVDPVEIQRHVGELRARGISTTTLGVGADFDEDRLRGMADVGGGHYYFIERTENIPDILMSEFQETLEVVARDVIIDVAVPGHVLVDPLNVVRSEQQGDRWRIFLGDIVSEQEVDIVLRFTFPSGELGDEAHAWVSLTDKEEVFGSTPARLDWRFEGHHANDTQPRVREVDREVACLYAARAKHEAVALNRQGHYKEARATLESVCARIAAYAGTDRVLRAIVDDLHREAESFGERMDQLSLKRAHFASANLSRMRDFEGKARKK